MMLQGYIMPTSSYGQAPQAYPGAELQGMDGVAMGYPPLPALPVLSQVVLALMQLCICQCSCSSPHSCQHIA